MRDMRQHRSFWRWQGISGIWVGTILHHLCIVNTILKLLTAPDHASHTVRLANADRHSNQWQGRTWHYGRNIHTDIA
jgi:hypothetical protein